MNETAPILNQFNLVVQDMEATLAFYRKLGLEIQDTDPAWAMHHRSAVMANGISLDFDSVEFASQERRVAPSGGRWDGRAGFRTAFARSCRQVVCGSDGRWLQESADAL